MERIASTTTVEAGKGLGLAVQEAIEGTGVHTLTMLSAKSARCSTLSRSFADANITWMLLGRRDKNNCLKMI